MLIQIAIKHQLIKKRGEAKPLRLDEAIIRRQYNFSSIGAAWLAYLI